MNKKSWLDYLFYKIGKQQYDFRLNGLRKTEEGAKSTRWKKYSEICFGINPWEEKNIEWINNREILPIEVVIDLEDSSLLDEVKRKLIEDKFFPFYVFSTGSRGYHIHIFNKTELSQGQKLALIKRYSGDEQKAGKTCIALEYANHWKSGKIKELVWKRLD
jgi:hypothetical protein